MGGRGTPTSPLPVPVKTSKRRITGCQYFFLCPFSTGNYPRTHAGSHSNSVLFVLREKSSRSPAAGNRGNMPGPVSTNGFSRSKAMRGLRCGFFLSSNRSGICQGRTSLSNPSLPAAQSGQKSGIGLSAAPSSQYFQRKGRVVSTIGKIRVSKPLFSFSKAEAVCAGEGGGHSSPSRPGIDSSPFGAGLSQKRWKANAHERASRFFGAACHCLLLPGLPGKVVRHSARPSLDGTGTECHCGDFAGMDSTKDGSTIFFPSNRKTPSAKRKFRYAK